MDDERTHDPALRRKLLKGSLSAPLVLTVGKAGAAARTTFTACLRNNEMQPEPPLAVSEPDEALRVTRDVFELHRVGTARVPERLEGRYILGWDNEAVYRLDEDGGIVRALSRVHDLNGRQPGLTMRKQGTIDVLAYLDDEGNVVGIAPQPNGGTWAMKSCYASIVGRPATPKRGWG